MSVKIRELRIKKNVYRILWLRYINGVNLKEHCMKSLLGYNDKRVRGYNFEFKDLTLDGARYYYFCGVEERFTYEKNIHLAFKEKQGSVIKVENEFFYAVIENAEVVPITNKDINWSLPQSANHLYSRCRNWWFANTISKEFVQAEQHKINF